MDSAATKTRIRRFLTAHTTLTLATVAEDGRPQAAALFYAELNDLSLVFISETKVNHSQNIARDKRVAVTIYADGQVWQTIKGLQLEGTCMALSGRVAREARNVYLEKFPFIRENRVLLAMLKVVTFYRIAPIWIRLIDNAGGFGHKEEVWL